MKVVSCLLVALHLLTVTAVGQDRQSELKPLPFVKDFEPSRYLGRWYEVARLATKVQPSGTLAVAEYSAAKEEGQVIVKNVAFDKSGKKLSEIRGKARFATGDPAGRLLVAFGPTFPETPNYQVIHVDSNYQFAVVGVPDRQSLWLLARKVPISKADFNRLREIAEEAGFEVEKLVVAPWENISPIPGADQDAGTLDQDKTK